MKKLIQVLIVCGLFVVMGGTANGGFFDELEKSLKESSKGGEQKREKEFKQSSEKLKTESASDIKPTGKLYDLYKMGSDNTDLQRKRMEKKIIGKVVIWKLKVYEVDLHTENIYKIQTSGESSVSSFAYILPESDEERDYIEELKTGSYITVKGKIEDISFRSISIKPAILWGEKWNKNKKISSAPSTNDCPSETDSLKRLICYDNLSYNLKNKNCISIIDSLKRLSCFESKNKSREENIQNKIITQLPEKDCGSKSNPINYPNPIMCPEHIEIMKTFVDNLENGNIDKIVNSINYPITFYKSGTGKVLISNSEQFKNFYEFIFSKRIIREIATNFSNNLEAKDFFWKKGRMMIGSGDIWFDLESGQVITINHTDDILITEMINSILNVDNMPIGWETPEGLIPPQCFFKEWMSSDNVGFFYKLSSIKSYKDFSENPGKYIGGNFPIDPIVPFWGGNEVFLAAPYDLCFNGSLQDGKVIKQKTPHVIKIDGNIIKSKSDSSDIPEYYLPRYEYYILSKVPQKKCQDLAPNLMGLCRQSFLIALGDDGGGSMGWVYEYNIYGLFSFKEKGKFIVPLKRFNKKKDAINYIDSIK